MMCMTELHGGVCHRTSTPHKSGNKMKEKKKKSYMSCFQIVGGCFFELGELAILRKTVLFIHLLIENGNLNLYCK